MNKKNSIILLESIYNIISHDTQLNLHVKYIVTDNEIALINSIKAIFPKIIHISCFYHYKKDLLINIKKYGLYKKR